MWGFEEKLFVVIGFEINDFDVFKVYVVVEMVDMVCDFWVLVKIFLCFVIWVFGYSI